MANPFSRVIVDYMVQGQTRVTWEIARHFLDPDPASWVYALQVSLHGQLPTYEGDNTTVRPDDWVTVGSPLTNVNQLIDTVQRSRGRLATTSYRVVLTTALGIYYSASATTLGALDTRDWLLAQEMVRKELLLSRVGTAVAGFLLRRKRDGVPCPKCLDPNTGEPTLSRCDVCKGNRYVAGYFAAVPTTYCSISPLTYNETTDEKMVGTTLTGMSGKGRMIAIPGGYSNDVWVDSQSDQRFLVRTVEVKAQIRHVPIVMEVELRLVDYGDIVYSLPIVEDVLSTGALRVGTITCSGTGTVS